MRRAAEMRTIFRQIPVLAGLVAMSLDAGLALETRGRAEPAILQIMEQVHRRNRAIGRALPAASALKADSRKGLASDAASLVRLATQARTLAEPARERKKPQQEWTQRANDFVRSSEELVRVIADPGFPRDRAIQSYQKLQRTCVNCHSAFREGAD
jgi:hypothetical protein